jgi:aryl-alcohol dehydrogenase-like predicted oxidoreductase
MEQHYVVATKYSLNVRDGDPNGHGNQRKIWLRHSRKDLKRLFTDYVDLYIGYMPGIL